MKPKATKAVRCDVESGSIFLKGCIDEAAALAVQKSIGLILKKNQDKPIYFFINSHGGEIDPAFAICHALSGCGRTVITIAQKNAQSSALLPVQMGLYRFAAPKTSFLIHEIHIHYHDTLTASQCMSIFKELTTSDTAMMIILGRSGQPMSNLSTMLEKGDFFFNSLDAKKMGFVDNVLPRNKKTPEQIRAYVTKFLAKNSKKTKSKSRK